MFIKDFGKQSPLNKSPHNPHTRFAKQSGEQQFWRNYLPTAEGKYLLFEFKLLFISCWWLFRADRSIDWLIICYVVREGHSDDFL